MTPNNFLGISELQPGLTTAPGKNDEVALIGRRCQDCGTRCFPARVRCVSCFGGNIEPTQLERVGKIDAFTIVRQGSPGYYGKVPYALAMVSIGDDMVTLSPLAGKPVDEWKRGDTVASYALVLPKGDEQTPLLTYAFHPATELDLAEA